MKELSTPTKVQRTLSTTPRASSRLPPYPVPTNRRTLSFAMSQSFNADATDEEPSSKMCQNEWEAGEAGSEQQGHTADTAIHFLSLRKFLDTICSRCRTQNVKN